MFAHLWTNKPAPWAYVELRLCRELRCTPSVLRQERAEDILNILTMLDVEARVQKARNGNK